MLDVSVFNTQSADLLFRSRSLEPLLSHIRHHLAEPLTIHDLAAIACRSRSGFHQYFKTVLGKSPKDYIRDLRIRKAQVLLAGSDLSIAEIGQQIGYPDPFHFSRVFKDVCGLSPKRFRIEQSRGLWATEKRGAPLDPDVVPPRA